MQLKWSIVAMQVARKSVAHVIRLANLSQNIQPILSWTTDIWWEFYFTKSNMLVHTLLLSVYVCSRYLQIFPLPPTILIYNTVVSLYTEALYISLVS